MSPLLFSKSPSSQLLNSIASSSHALSNDTQRLDLIKALDQALTKFLNLKKNSNSNSTLKANILRLHLLPYLRHQIQPFDNLNQLVSTSLTQLNVDLLFVEVRCLLNWWTELLNILLIDYQSILSHDRNCYYESISRIVSHNIWFLFQFNTDHSAQFHDIYENYKKLLLKTFELAILRLTAKTVSLSVSIFVGKVFAYSFFNLDDIARGISFLLNTKLNNFKKIYNICIFDSFTNNSSNHRNNSRNNNHRNTSNIESKIFDNKFSNILNDLATQFPNHLIPLISSNIQPRYVKYSIESQFINSIFPPREKIDGIRETKGVWVNRWCSLDNVSIFCSFFRNYLTIASIYMKNFPELMVTQHYVFGIPGFLCFLTHIYEIFSIQIKSLAAKHLNSNSKFKNSFNNSNNISYNDNLLTVPPTILVETNIDKCFNVLRDFLINPRNSNEKLLKSGVIKGFENIIKLFIVRTNILDNFMVETIMNLFIQFVRHIDDSSDLDSSNVSLLDWKFWLDIIIRLLDSNNLNCEVKAISTLYQIWDLIPDDIYDYSSNPDSCHWISNNNENLRVNITTYLLDIKNWLKFFGHYMPLERHLYIKLVIWKILGLYSTGNIINYEDYKFKKSLNESKIIKIVQFRLSETYKKTDGMVFKPSDPVVNKKFKIVKSANLDDKKRDKKLRVYSFEVLDDSVYTGPRNNNSLLNRKKSFSSSTLTSKSSTIVNSNVRKSSSIDSFDSYAKHGSNTSTNTNLNVHSSKKNSWMGKFFSKSSKTSTHDNLNKSFSKLLNISNKSLNKKDGTTINNSPISSLSSSLSSLELNSVENNNNMNHINTAEESGSEETDLSYPPEWKYDIEINKKIYEFVLVDNEIKIQSFLQKLNHINQANKHIKFNDELLIINDEPRLPTIKLDNQLDFSDSLDSVTDEAVSGDDIFLGNEEIDDNLIDLNGGFYDVNDIGLNIDNGDNNYGYFTGTKIFDNGTSTSIKNNMKNSPASLFYLSNGILEYNEETLIFENFIKERIVDLNLHVELHDDSENSSKPSYNWHNNIALFNASSSSVLEIQMENKHRENIIRLSKPDYDNLKQQIPSIVPDLAGDKLNAY